MVPGLGRLCLGSVGVLGLIGVGPVCVGGGVAPLLLEALGSRGCVWRGCVSSVQLLCLGWARLSCPGLRGRFAPVPRVRMALLLCLRAERVAGVSRLCVALLVCLGVRDCRAMGLSV